MSRKSHQKAWDYFVSIGAIPADANKHEYHLHHKDSSWRENDPERYEQWNVEDLEVLSASEHAKHHQLGKKSYIKGKTRSDDFKKRVSVKMRQWHEENECHHSEETKQKLSKSHLGMNTWIKGTHWYTNGIVNVRCKECPEGFIPGRI